MALTIKEAIKYSANKLDSIMPNWHTMIHTGSLNMMHPDFCLAGQLVALSNNYTKYDEFVIVHKLVPEVFYVCRPENYPVDEIDWKNVECDEYSYIKEAWLEEINSRKQKAEVTDAQ